MADGETLPISAFQKCNAHDKDFRYVKHRVLPPETGIDNMSVSCHEYKSLEIVHKFESIKLQAKVVSEVLRLACGCMNMRTNGTIHFGVMDKKKGFKHGEIIGIPIENQSDYVDALDYIEKCFKGSEQQTEARRCINNPKFIEVIDGQGSEVTWIVEFDIAPEASVVKGKLYSVEIPKFSNNKVIHKEKECCEQGGGFLINIFPVPPMEGTTGEGTYGDGLNASHPHRETAPYSSRALPLLRGRGACSGPVHPGPRRGTGAKTNPPDRHQGRKTLPWWSLKHLITICGSITG